MNYDYVLVVTDSNDNLAECTALCLCKAVQLSSEIMDDITMSCDCNILEIVGNQTYSLHTESITIKPDLNMLYFGESSDTNINFKLEDTNNNNNEKRVYTTSFGNSQYIFNTIEYDIQGKSDIALQILENLFYGKVEVENAVYDDNGKLISGHCTVLPISSKYFPLQNFQLSDGKYVPALNSTRFYLWDSLHETDNTVYLRGLLPLYSFPISLTGFPYQYNANTLYAKIYKRTDFDNDVLINKVPIVSALLGKTNDIQYLLKVSQVENHIDIPGKYNDPLKILGAVCSTEVVPLVDDLNTLPAVVNILNVSE